MFNNESAVDRALNALVDILGARRGPFPGLPPRNDRWACDSGLAGAGLALTAAAAQATRKGVPNFRLTRDCTVRTLRMPWRNRFEKAPRKRVVNYRSY
jgi:hypothetical protein